MKKRWALISALGILAPVAVAAPMFATSCGSTSQKQNSHIISGNLSPRTDLTFAKDKTLKDWIGSETVSTSHPIQTEIKDLFGDNTTLTKDNVATITVAEKKSQLNDNTPTPNVTITVTLKDGYVFSNSDGSLHLSKTFDATVTKAAN